MFLSSYLYFMNGIIIIIHNNLSLKPVLVHIELILSLSGIMHVSYYRLATTKHVLELGVCTRQYKY